MKTQAKIILTTLVILLASSGCEIHMAPSEYWRRMFGTETDSDYYGATARKMVKEIFKVAKEYDINKIAVMEFVDEEGRVPVLGEYMSSRIVQEVARKKYFRVAQKGEVREVLAKLDLTPSQNYSQDEAKRIGQSLNTQALITGELTDIGTNIDIHITMIDIVSGEVIGSATEGMVRTRFAVEMLRQH